MGARPEVSPLVLLMWFWDVGRLRLAEVGEEDLELEGGEAFLGGAVLRLN